MNKYLILIFIITLFTGCTETVSQCQEKVEDWRNDQYSKFNQADKQFNELYTNIKSKYGIEECTYNELQVSISRGRVLMCFDSSNKSVLDKMSQEDYKLLVNALDKLNFENESIDRNLIERNYTDKIKSCSNRK